jgi:hypothetical protein
MLAELIAEFEKMSSGEEAGRRSSFRGDHQEIIDGSVEL